MEMSLFITFILSCFIFSFSPGAGAVASMLSTMEGGFKQAKYTILGLQLALAIHLIIVSLGIGAFVASSEVTFNLIKYSGAFYLFYLGVQKIRSNAASLTIELSNAEHLISNSERSKWSLIISAVVVNLTNPKSIIFLVAFLPQYLDLSQGMDIQLVIFGGLILAIDTLAMLFFVMFAHTLKMKFSNQGFQKRLNIVFGGLFMLLATALFFSNHQPL